MSEKKCRFCRNQLKETFVDLGMSPLSNAYITEEKINAKEAFYPLHAYVCEKCFLVQLEEFETPDTIFSDYAYFSSYSDSWLTHARNYTESMCKRFSLNNQHKVIEIASNDGYLLQYFKQRGIAVLGIEPAQNVAQVAEEKGISTIVKFFGRETAQELHGNQMRADLLLGNNVLAHVPDINDFVAGMKIVLNDDGVITMEFPHLLQLIKERQFDTIYHEHFSYLSFITVQQIFSASGLRIFDVDKLSTHGGSLRIYACHSECMKYEMSINVKVLLEEERNYGLEDIKTYRCFAEKTRELKRDLLKLLIELREKNKQIVGYGAPAKGNTLLNYCGIRNDFIEYTVDKNPHKQKLFLPGTHIPIFEPEKIRQTKPDYVFILPWNLKDEIIQQMSFIREWGGKFIVAIPKIEVL